jgi:mono/diheme cytochrome c family protein
MRLIAAILVVLFVGGAGALIVIETGVYDVGMNNHDHPLVNQVIETAVKKSVQRHAQGIAEPPLADTALINLGAREYRPCLGCHGAPGVPKGNIAKGLWPEAPDLSKTADEWTPSELYWIIKNGLKFTAMPAWGPSHDDHELWAMTAFVHQLPKMSPAQYKELTERLGIARPGGPGAPGAPGVPGSGGAPGAGRAPGR